MTIFSLIRSKLGVLKHAHPLAKGMISYGIIWPTSCAIQQTFEGKNLKTLNWWRVMRFSLYAAFYVAPTLYCWVKLSSAMWPRTTFKIGLTKAIVEQISYRPFSSCSFFYVMSLLEMKTHSEAAQEVKNKFLPTYKVGFCFWTISQTVNFSVIPESNRVVFTSMCSFIWTMFLSYMKAKNITADKESNKTHLKNN